MRDAIVVIFVLRLPNMGENKNKSPHILNTSSQLLGLCFIVLTAIKIQNLKHVTIIDEITAMAAMLFMASSILSFLSIRDKPTGVRLTKRSPILFSSSGSS